MAITTLLCSLTNPANGTAATVGNTGFLVLTTAAGGSKTFDSSVGIHANTGLAIVNASGTNQARTNTFTASLVGKVTLTFKTPATNPAAALTYWNFRNSGGVSFRLEWSSTGALWLFDGGSTAHTILSAGVMSNGTNYTIQCNFTVATTTTGVFNLIVLDSTGTQVGSTYSFTGNLGTAGITQFDGDQDAAANSYGIAEIQYDMSSASGFIPPWTSTGVTINAVPASAQADAITPTVTADVAVTGVAVPGAYAGVPAPTVTVSAAATVAAVPAASYAGVPAPVIATTFAVNIAAVPAGSRAGAPAPAVSGSASAAAVPASAFAGAPAPAVGGGASITAVRAAAYAVGFVPVVSGEVNVTGSSVPNARAGVRAPVVSAGATVSALPAAAYAGVVAPTATVVAAASVGLTGSGTLSASASAPAIATGAPLTGTGVLVASASDVTQSTTAHLSGAGILTVVVGASPATTASLSGSGVLTAASAARFLSPAALFGAGTLSASVLPAVSTAASLSGAGLLTATDRPGLTSLAQLSGSGVLTAVAYAPIAPDRVTLPGPFWVAFLPGPNRRKVGTSMIDTYVQESNEFIPVSLSAGGVQITSAVGVSVSIVPYSPPVTRPGAYVPAVQQGGLIGFYSGGLPKGALAVFVEVNATPQVPVKLAGRIMIV